ncbi:hypothetical protein JNM05_09655 [bacterium]|nr:hypothetical protein [bacterium]
MKLIQILLILFVSALPIDRLSGQDYFISSLESDAGNALANLSRAKWEYDQTTLLHRLIPKVVFSMSLLTSGYLFPTYDQSIEGFAPRNGYHMTMSWNITELLSTATRQKAYFELRHANHQYGVIKKQIEHRSQAKNYLKEKWLSEKVLQEKAISNTKEELKLTKELLELAVIKFNQGECFSDLVIQKKLAVLDVEKKLSEEEQRYSQIVRQLEQFTTQENQSE